MHRNRLGCLSGTGMIAALVTALAIAGFAYAKGGLLYNPGPLNAQRGETLGGVASHAEIGGDCAACHTAPWEPARMEDRCIACHGEIAVQMQDVATMHGSMLTGQPDLRCRFCHPEHRGADAKLTELGGWKFPHESVGFSLSGHPRTVTGEAFVCSDCHGEDISKFDPQTCDACHRQVDLGFMAAHTLSFGSACLACHDGVDSLVTNFDHNDFEFKISGGHTGVACVNCHLNARAIGDFQTTSQACQSCHYNDDPHGGRFGADCAACHAVDGWKPANFDHNRSNFPLTGEHASLACEQCHDTGQLAGLSTACAGCHADPAFHAGMFGTDCAVCHTTNNWYAAYTGSHPGIADEGGRGVDHGGASCRDCHTQTLHSATCLACHDTNNPDDDHEGNHD